MFAELYSMVTILFIFSLVSWEIQKEIVAGELFASAEDGQITNFSIESLKVLVHLVLV